MATTDNTISPAVVAIVKNMSKLMSPESTTPEPTAPPPSEPTPSPPGWQPYVWIPPTEDAEDALDRMAPVIERFAITQPDVALEMIENAHQKGELKGDQLEIAFSLIPLAQQAHRDRLETKRRDYEAREQHFDALYERVYQAQDALAAAKSLRERAKALYALRQAEDAFLAYPNPAEEVLDLDDPDYFPSDAT